MPTGANVPVDPTYMSEPSFPAYKQFHSANAPLEFEENEQMGVYPNNTGALPALQRAGFPVTFSNPLTLTLTVSRLPRWTVAGMALWWTGASPYRGQLGAHFSPLLQFNVHSTQFTLRLPRWTVAGMVLWWTRVYPCR